MKKIFFLLFTLLTVSNYAQKLDSLKNAYNIATTDTSKFSILSSIIISQLTDNPDISEQYGLKQIALAQSIKQKAIAHLNLGLSFDYQNKFKEAQEHYNLSLEYCTELKDSIGMSKALLNLGIVNYYKGDLDNAIYYYVKSLDISESIEQVKLKASALSNLGIAHKELNEYDIALKYNLRSLELEIELNDKDGIATSYNNLGMNYRGLKEYDTALEYYDKALQMRKETNDDNGIASVLTNIGQIYYAQKNYLKSIQYNIESVRYEEKVGNDIGVAESYINIGDCYIELGKIDEAINYHTNSLKVGEENEKNDIVLASLEGLSLAYSIKGNYEKAFALTTRYAKLKDDLFDEARMNKVKELEAKYHSEKSEKENELLKKENTINQLEIDQKNILERNLYIGLGLVFLVLLVVFYAYRNNKISSQKLTLRNNKIELMNLDLKSKNQSITDSIIYAKRIQEAILPADSFVKKNLVDSFIFYRPKDIVSGDFYWMEEKNDEILIAVVDCTGHGVPGAFMSIVGSNGLNKTVRELDDSNPAIILDALNDYVVAAIQVQKSEVKDGMDISLCSVNLSNKVLKFAGAYNPLYIFRNNELKIYNGDRQSIGDVRRQFNQHNIQLKKSDVCYIFTDGYTDQFGGERNKKYNFRRFRETLKQIHTFPMEYQKEELVRNFEEWKGNEEQLDDICVIGFKI